MNWEFDFDFFFYNLIQLKIFNKWMAHHIYSCESQISLKFSRGHILPHYLKKLMLYVSVCTKLHLDFKNGLDRPYRERVKVCALVMVKTPPLAKQSWIKLKSLICIKCKDFEKESCSRLPSQQSPAVHTFRWLHQMQPLEFGHTDHSLFLWNCTNLQSYK